MLQPTLWVAWDNLCQLGYDEDPSTLFHEEAILLQFQQVRVRLELARPLREQQMRSSLSTPAVKPQSQPSGLSLEMPEAATPMSMSNANTSTSVHPSTPGSNGTSSLPPPTLCCCARVLLSGGLVACLTVHEQQAA